jgi:exopolysaccharide biosynthesis predicted pyruvyltransferase EpsI
MTDPYFEELSEKASVWHSDATCRQEQELQSSSRDRLSGKIDELIVPFIVYKSEHICLIDLPWHPNVGDSTILLGELSFFKRKFPSVKLSLGREDLSFSCYLDARQY